MTVRGRILAIRLSEKLEKTPGLAEKAGVKIDFKKAGSHSDTEKNLSE